MFLTLGVFVCWSVFLLSRKQRVDPIPAIQANVTAIDSGAERMNRSKLPIETSNTWYPSGAIPGERIIHFSNREDYLSYLKTLSESGLSPKGTIDALLAIRVSDTVLSQLNPAIYGGQEHFSYQIEQPLPPAELNPELLSELRAFDASAGAIIGGEFEGDGSGVLVGILDSGIEDHAYFDGLNIDSVDLTGRGISGAGSGHGAAVASIIAGKEGIAPAADLLVIRVLDDQGVGSSFDLANGIIHAVDQGAQVINLSLGLYQDTQTLRDAVRYAQAQGVILVAAAGNDGYSQLPYPAAYPQVLSVTAVDGRGRQAVFPNQSEAIDFAAPGVGISAVGEDANKQLFSGTSAAAPFVTGTLAALLSADSTLTAQQAVELLGRYLDDAGAAGTDPIYGGGLLNWDRLRERATKDVNDLALADIYLQAGVLPGTTMPVEVTVQNRGTAWMPVAELTVLVGESAPQKFTVGTLAPGQTTTRKIHVQVPTLQSGEMLQIAARVLTEDVFGDVRPENNAKAVFFRPMVLIK